MAVRSASPTVLRILDEFGLPNLPSDWNIIRIEALLEADRGISVGVMYPGDHDPEGIPLIKAGDLADGFINPRPGFRITQHKHFEYRRTEFEGGELLISLVGDVGRCAIVPLQMAGWNAARAVAVLRFIEPTDADFVRLCLASAPLQNLMNAWSTTTVQATLNLKEIRQIPIPWPPKQQRDFISNVLRSLEDKIELNRRMNETLEAMARALFKSWFVDFDPVRAKTEGRDTGLQKNIADMFPDSIQNSELGNIPRGWRVGTIGEIADQPRRAIRHGDITVATPYIALEHMPRHSIALCDWEYADGLRSGKLEFKKGEILFGKLRPYFHKVGIAPLDGVCSTDIVVMAARGNQWPGFLLGHVASEDFVRFTNSASTGTKMPRTNWRDMARYMVALPPDILARSFTHHTDLLIDRMTLNVHESHALTAIRNDLLPRLISGEVRAKSVIGLM